MYKYPYGNYSQLNLNWIINKIKELDAKIGSGGAGGSADLQEVATALISAEYSSTQAYAVNDIVYDPDTESLYRCNTAIPAGGEAWNPAHWDAIMIGPTLSNLVRAVAGMSSDDVFNHSDVDGSTVTDALNALKTALESVAAIVGSGQLQGFTATDLTGAANELKGSLNAVENGLAIIVTGDTCTTAVPSGGYAYIKNNTHGLTEGLYRNKSSGAFPTSGGTADSTVFEAVSTGGLNALQAIIDVPTGINGLFAYRCGNIVTMFTKNATMYLPEITTNGWIHPFGDLPSELLPKTNPNSNNYVKTYALTNHTNQIASMRIGDSSPNFEIYGMPSYSAEAINIFFSYIV